MRIITLLSPLLGALIMSAVLTAGLLTSAPAHADTSGALAAFLVTDTSGTCGHGSPTVDDVVTSAASAVRSVIPATELRDRTRRLRPAGQRFPPTIAAVRVHRDELPADPTHRVGWLGQLDDPIVSYLVDGLDAVRTGRLDHTISVSRLTVNDVIEVFILANRIVKIPAQVLAGLVPTAGSFLSFIVGGVFTGVQWPARRVQHRMRETYLAPGTYAKLDLTGADLPTEHVAVPAPIADLAKQVVPANGGRTPISDLTAATVLERTRAYLAHSDLPLDRTALGSIATGLQEFPRDNRIAKSP